MKRWIGNIAAAGTALGLLFANGTPAQDININFYASKGMEGVGLTPQTDLVGVVGDASETWNQFNTDSGSNLLNTAGTATTVGFTNNLPMGWGNMGPGLTLLIAHRAVWEKGKDTSLTITGLTPGAGYDIYLYSHNQNRSAHERSLGTWSTTNPTTGPSSQLIDARTAYVHGTSGNSFTAGLNYVLFQNVEADGTGQIAFAGDAADVGDYDDRAYRLLLNGIQIRAAKSAGPASFAAGPGFPDLAALPSGSLRFANGAPISDAPIRVAPEGLEIQTPRGPQMAPWSQLSLGTRYRLQPGFRDALPKILAGEAVPVAAVEAPTAPDPAPAVPSPAPSAPATPPKPSPAHAAAKIAFPKGTFPEPAKTAMFGVAFSDDPADLLLVGVDLPEPGKLPLEIVYWWPHRTPAVQPERVKHYRSGPGNFQAPGWSGSHGGYQIEVEFFAMFKTVRNQWRAVGNLKVSMQKRGYRARYFLRNREIPTAAATAPLKVAKPFSPPALALRITEGGRRMLATLQTGGWDILPLQGVDTNLNVELLDEQGRTVEKDRVKTDEETVKAKSEAWQYDFKRMKGGETYTVKASINLGTFFGEAAAQQTVQAVDLK